MSTKYQINVFNKSASSQVFYFFSQPPTASDIDSKDIYVNSLWQSASTAPDTGTASFQTAKTTYAIVAITTGDIGVGTVVTTADSRVVKLGAFDTKASKATVEIAQNSAQFTDVADESVVNEPPSGFVLQTNPFNPSDVKAAVGLGAESNTPGLIVPLAVTNAQPNKVINFFPVTTYYVATGEYQAGKIVNFSQVSVDAAECNFTGGVTTRNVNYNPDGTWTVT